MFTHRFYIFFPATEQRNLIPEEILRMDKRSIELYKRALSEGEEHVYNIRVMVVGHYGVGKTTLTKRLLDEVVDINKRESTNGIDVHVRRCNVCLKTGQWSTIPKGEYVSMHLNI
jgi:polynucleotide 5'-kinase involved in rRNA processing